MESGDHEPTISTTEVAIKIASIFVLLWVGLVLSLAPGRGQNLSIEPQPLREPIRSETVPDYTIRVASDLVLIPVAVTDEHDGFIAGLTREQFRLYEDDVEQAITHFVVEDAPASVGIVFDASASMAGKIRKSREAVATLLKMANLEDEFFLVQFNSGVELVLSLTQNAKELQNRLRLLQPQGATALWDAIKFSLQEMKNAHYARRALVIVSDGGDNFSRYTLEEVQSAVRETDAQIYAIGIYEPVDVRARTPEELIGPDVLRTFTEDTGGRLFEIADTNGLAAIASKIGKTLRSQYVLGYKPLTTRHDGKYHRVRVTLDFPEGSPKPQARWRKGYYAPTE